MEIRYLSVKSKFEYSISNGNETCSCCIDLEDKHGCVNTKLEVAVF